MDVKYSESYIDALLERKDAVGIHQVITVVGEKKEVPDGLWLFCRALEWLGSLRSGVWQYYENAAANETSRIQDLLQARGLANILKWFTFGFECWKDEGKIKELDNWLIENEMDIEEQILSIVLSERDKLKAFVR